MIESQAEFEAMVRRYVAKLFARYAPVLAALAVLLVVLILVPTTQPVSPTSSLATGSGGQALASGAAANQGAVGGQAVGPQTGAPGGSAPGADGGGPAAQVPGSVAAGTAQGPAANFLAAAGSAGGVSRTGVRCGPGVRQFGWTGHAPNCEAAFSGNNGGATGQGVTPTTITLTFRVPSSTQDQAIQAAAGAANVNYSAMIADLQAYINFFNTQFELYGRHVVLKPFNGQGDYIQEDQGQNLAAAQADAVTAHDMGAFGDVTFTLGSSQAYEQDLASEHVMSFSSIAQPQSFYEQLAPYEWSVQGASGSVAVQEAAALVCRRMAGLPAAYSGDALAQRTTRVFGIIYPETPNYSAEANQYKQLLQQQCGQTVKQTDGYSINVAQFPNQAATIMAQMNAAHVTTVLCACDPIFPVFLTRAASGQSYHPEWVSTSFGDPSGRLYDQSEWQHDFGSGVQFPDPKTTEAYRAYVLGNPGHQPAEGTGNGGPPYFYVPYYTLLHVFEGLQAAGPDLTAASFQQGMFALPPSTGSDPIGGQWRFGANVYDPIVSFSIAWWNPNAKSAFDGSTGMYAVCNGGQTYTVDHLEALGGPKQQLNCFGH